MVGASILTGSGSKEVRSKTCSELWTVRHDLTQNVWVMDVPHDPPFLTIVLHRHEVRMGPFVMPPSVGRESGYEVIPPCPDMILELVAVIHTARVVMDHHGHELL